MVMKVCLICHQWSCIGPSVDKYSHRTIQNLIVCSHPLHQKIIISLQNTSCWQLQCLLCPHHLQQPLQLSSQAHVPYLGVALCPVGGLRFTGVGQESPGSRENLVDQQMWLWCWKWQTATRAKTSSFYWDFWRCRSGELVVVSLFIVEFLKFIWAFRVQY